MLLMDVYRRYWARMQQRVRRTENSAERCGGARGGILVGPRGVDKGKILCCDLSRTLSVT